MVEVKPHTRVQIYSLEGRELRIEPTHRIFRFNPTVEKFAQSRWLERRLKWKNAYAPAAESIVYTMHGQVVIRAGISQYSQHIGAIEAIQEGLDFAPVADNGLGVTAYVVSEDGKMVFKKRPRDNPHAPGFFDGIGGGWMTTANIVGLNAGCEDIRVALVPQLYEPFWQAISEYEEESKLKEALFELDEQPRLISRGLGVGLNLGISFFGRAKLSAAEIMEAMKGNEKRHGIQEHENNFVAVPMGRLEALLGNQPRLLAMNKQELQAYQHKDPDGVDVPLVDEFIGALWANYEALTGHARPESLSRSALAQEGLQIDLFPRDGDLSVERDVTYDVL